jgi:hypothetical protein
MTMIDTRKIDQAIEFAANAAKKASEYKSETYFAVLVSLLLAPTNVGASSDQVHSEGPAVSSNSQSQKQYSAAELFASTTWETEIEKATLAGYFLERYSAMPNYSVDEIRKCIISAKVPAPANVNLAVLKAAQKGWMMELPGQGERHKVWSLTQTGERTVEEMISATKK